METPLSAVEMMLQLYLLEFYIGELGLEPLRASAVIAIAILWDAITDPVIGFFSDKRKPGRYGKRMQFMLPGAVGLALSASLLFNPAHDLTQNMLTAWLFVSYMALNTTMTLIAIPHIACVGDYAASDQQRNVLLGWRMLFANIGLVLSIALPAILAGDQANSGNKGAAAIICSVLVIATTTLCATSLDRVPVSNQRTHKKDPGSSAGTDRFWNILTGALRNRAFLPVLIAFVVAGIARSINSGLALFYYKITLGLDEKSQVSLILLVFIIAITVSIPAWVFAGKIWGKKTAVLGGIFSLAILTMSTYPYFSFGSMTGPLAMAVLGGAAVGSILLIESMVVSAIDEDEILSGFRRDAAYFGIWKMFAKASRAIGIATVGPILVWTGYSEGLGQQQTTLTSERIGDVFGYGVGALFFISAVVFCFVPTKKTEN